MPLKISKNKITELLNAKSLDGANHVACNFEFDSRKVKGGELFVGLKGEGRHGQDYSTVAFSRGAALFLVENEAVLDKFENEKDRILIVPDSLEAITKIAAWWREEVKLPTIAVTGSVGKTTVKDMLAAILLQHSLGNFALSSFNNHIGVPYTICQGSSTHVWQVLEMGMNHAGELSALSQLAKPNVAIITKIAPAHIGYFGTLEAIARAKLEIIEGLSNSGTLILNADDPVLMSVCTEILTKDKLESSNLKIKYFSSSKPADIQVVSSQISDKLRLLVKLSLDAQEFEVEVKLPAEYHASNVAAAVLAAKTLVPSITIEQIQKGLLSFSPSDGRMSLRRINSNRAIIDDSYNANPESMSGALKLAATLSKKGHKLSLILGDMKELGDLSSKYHLDLVGQIKEVQPQHVILVGEQIKTCFEPLKAAGLKIWQAENALSAGHLAHKLEFNYLLVKASNSVGLSAAVSSLLETEGELLQEAEA